MEEKNLRLQKKYQDICDNEVRYETYLCDDAEYLMIAFGSVARIAMEAIDKLRQNGIKIGLFRPITLWPFPGKEIARISQQTKGILVPEMNAGQMIIDVRLAVEGRTPIRHFGRLGGIVPTPDELADSFNKNFIHNA